MSESVWALRNRTEGGVTALAEGGQGGGGCSSPTCYLPVSATVTSSSAAGTFAFFSSFSFTNWRSRSQNVSR